MSYRRRTRTSLKSKACEALFRIAPAFLGLVTLGCPDEKRVRLIVENYGQTEQTIRIEIDNEILETDTVQCGDKTFVSAVDFDGDIQRGRVWSWGSPEQELSTQTFDEGASGPEEEISTQTFHEGAPGSVYNHEVHCLPAPAFPLESVLITAVTAESTNNGVELNANSWTTSASSEGLTPVELIKIGPAQTMDTFQDPVSHRTSAVTYLPEGTGTHTVSTLDPSSLIWIQDFDWSPSSPLGVSWDASTGSPEFKAVYLGDGRVGMSWNETFIERQHLDLITFINGEPVNNIRFDDQPTPAGFNNTIATDLKYAFGKVYAAYHTTENGATSVKGAVIDPDTGEFKTVFLGAHHDFGGAFSNVPSLKVVPLDQGRTSKTVNYVRFTDDEPGSDSQRGIEVASFDEKLEDCIVFPFFVPWRQAVMGVADDGPELEFPPVPPQSGDPSISRKIKAALSIASIDIFEVTFSSQLNFAQFADGAGLFSQLLLSNPSGEVPVTARVSLRGQTGDPIPFDLEDGRVTIPGSDPDGTLDVEVPPSGKVTLQTDGSDDIVVGSATVVSARPLSGVIVFGGSAGLAGVDSSPELTNGFSAPVETNSAENINTGVAVMNLGDVPVTLKIRLCDSEGNVVATASDIVLAPRGQGARFVTELEWDPPVDFSLFDGVLKVSADGETAATVLQTRNAQFASMPVAAN